MFLNIARVIASLAYGGITLIGAIAALAQKPTPFPVVSCVLMIIGSVLLLLGNVKYVKSRLSIILISLLSIQVAALTNGFYQGHINISHHIIRLFVSIIIFFLFYFSKKSSRR